MKNIIRKIASVGAGITMLGATVGGALAADLSDLDTGAPFVVDGDYVNTAIVVGASSDDNGARDTLRDHFDGFVTSTTSGGETYTLGTSSAYIELGELISATKSTLTKSQMSEALGDNQLTDESTDVDYDYDQKITVSTTAQPEFKTLGKLDYYAGADGLDNSGEKDPTEVMDFTSGQYAYTYNLSFDDSSGVDISLLADGEKITMMGQEFVIKTSGAATDIELFTGSESLTLGLADSGTLGGHSVSFTGIDTAGDATFSVDGDQSNYVGSGDSLITDTLDSDTENMYVEDLTVVGVAGTDSVSYSVTLNYGSGKITLQEAGEGSWTDIKVGDETISGVESDVGGTDNTGVTYIGIRFDPNAYYGDEVDDESGWNLESGETITDPFLGVSFTFDGADMSYDSSDKTPFMLDRNSDDTVDLTFTNMNDETFTFTVFERETTSDNITFYNDSDTETFHWNAASATIHEEAVFMVREGTDSEDVTRVYKVKSISSDNKTTIVLMDSYGTEEVTNGDDGDEFGYDDSITIAAVEGSADDRYLNLTFGGTASLVGNGTTFYTMGEASVVLVGLPRNNDTNYGNATTNEVVFTESDELAGDSSIEALTINLGEEVTSADDYLINMVGAWNVTSNNDDDDDDWRYALTSLGTYMKQELENEGDSIHVYYTQDSVEYAVTYGAGTTTSATSADLKLDSEDVSGVANLILVGGPCVNSVTATWLGVSAGSCGTDSGIPENDALIELKSMGDQTALIVAGWEKADTQGAATKISQGGLTGPSVYVSAL